MPPQNSHHRRNRGGIRHGYFRLVETLEIEAVNETHVLIVEPPGFWHLLNP